MLYQKNQSPQLDMSLFRNPTAEYRGAPFWAWNCQLSEQELLWQIERLKEMGFGGFHMHTRSGMATKYLSDDFMSLIQACTQKAKEENMLAWLYDEDRWPSGAAGGFVTKDPRYRQRCLRMSIRKPETLPKEQALQEGGAWLLACYDVVLNSQGELEQYRRCPEDTEPQGTLWYAFCEVYSSFSKSAGWYNGQTYVDTMSKAAISRFVEITHERYKEAVGTEFGKTVPAIFSDEPQLSHKVNLPFAHSKQDAILPWTPDFTESFREACGYDILDRLPELFWDRKDGAVSQARYHFHDQSCECFAAAFADTIGRWCQENGIHMTGHMYRETTLLQQAQTTGEVMRSYRSFHIPGIDMLFNGTEYDTAKQAQSAAHQYGREGVLSELYGVTNWDFDFRGHKTQGDWQAALGITVRVPHLSWVSMKGAAKRDYPASINYQVPWYREYPLIEDHFARLNTVLTRGKPVLPKRIPLRTLDCKEAVEYIRQEDNVCLLDMAEYALDDGPFQPMEEILRIDKALREPFGWPLASGQDMQPWAMEKEPTEHSVILRFRFRSELALEGLHFCAEELEALQLNGQPVFPVREGYFVDKSIGKYPLPPIREGENVLLARIPFNKQESLEACYLTGDFDVTLIGCEKVLKKAGKTVGFGDIVGQGMPFYGGNLTYRVPFHLDRDCNLHIDLAKYIGALTKVALDGENRGAIVFAPYTLEVKNVAAGDHILEFTLFGNRHNTFGGLHNCGDNIYYGQHYWYSEGQSWSYEYRTKPTGILKSPVITLYPADSET